MKINTIPANRDNYTKGRVQNIKYIVLHYTANNGDTAEGNCNYFASSGRNASAHYFVDENNIYQSVADMDTAWSVGSSSYVHGICRNSNSISVEMCSRLDSYGNYYIKEETISNAVKLFTVLMGKYNVPVENILRHYDVTGKKCPEPFVRNISQWTAFKKRLEEEKLEKSAIKISVNGMDKTLQGYNVDDTNYVSIRDLCGLLELTVEYDSVAKKVILTK